MNLDMNMSMITKVSNHYEYESQYEDDHTYEYE